MDDEYSTVYLIDKKLSIIKNSFGIQLKDFTYQLL